MRDWLRTLIAGYAGWKWGGGCLGFIVVLVLSIFYLEMFIAKNLFHISPSDDNVFIKYA
jgi:hypothetical protein